MKKSAEGWLVQVPKTSGAKRRAGRQRRGAEIYTIINDIRLGRCERSVKEVRSLLSADASNTRHQRTSLFELEVFDLMQETVLGALFPGDRTMPGPVAIGRAAATQAMSFVLEYSDYETAADLLEAILLDLPSDT